MMPTALVVGPMSAQEGVPVPVVLVWLLELRQLQQQPSRILMEDFVEVQASSPCLLRIAAQSSHVVVVVVVVSPLRRLLANLEQ